MTIVNIGDIYIMLVCKIEVFRRDGREKLQVVEGNDAIFFEDVKRAYFRLTYSVKRLQVSILRPNMFTLKVFAVELF